MIKFYQLLRFATRSILAWKMYFSLIKKMLGRIVGARITLLIHSAQLLLKNLPKIVILLKYQTSVA